MLLLASFGKIALGEESVKLYPFIFAETTGSNKSILIDKKIRSVQNFSAQSTPSALKSLQALKSNILYENGGGNKIFIRGVYNDSDGAFILKSWFIIAPFFSRELISEEKLPHEYKLVKREGLRAEDFGVNVGELSKFVFKLP